MSKFSSDTIVEEVRRATDIVDIISQYVRLQKRGKNYLGLCPFHTEKTPSFTVNREKGLYHCFGCGAGGNVFTFLTEHDKISFGEALRQQAQGDIELVPPTWVTLWRLRTLPSVAAALDTARGAEPEHFSTHMVSHRGELVALWHGDAGYDDGDVERPGGRHRLRMSADGWRYERSGPPAAAGLT